MDILIAVALAIALLNSLFLLYLLNKITSLKNTASKDGRKLLSTIEENRKQAESFYNHCVTEIDKTGKELLIEGSKIDELQTRLEAYKKETASLISCIEAKSEANSRDVQTTRKELDIEALKRENVGHELKLAESRVSKAENMINQILIKIQGISEGVLKGSMKDDYLEKQLDNLSSISRELEKSINNAADRITAEITERERAVSELRKDISVLSRISDLTEKHSEKLEGLNSELMLQGIAREKLNSEIKLNRKSVEGLENMLVALESEMKNISERLSKEMAYKHEEMINNFHKLSDADLEIRSVITSQEKSIDRLSSHMQSEKQRIDSMESHLKEIVDFCEELSGEIKDRQAELSRLNKQFSLSSNRNEQNISEVHKILNGIKKELNYNATSIKKVDDNLRKESRERQLTMEKLAKINRRFATELKNSAQRLESHKKLLKAEIDGISSYARELDAQLKLEALERKKSSAVISSNRRRSKRLESRIISAASRLRRLNKSLREEASKRARLMIRLSRLKKSFTATRRNATPGKLAPAVSMRKSPGAKSELAQG